MENTGSSTPASAAATAPIAMSRSVLADESWLKWTCLPVILSMVAAQ